MLLNILSVLSGLCCYGLICCGAVWWIQKHFQINFLFVAGGFFSCRSKRQDFSVNIKWCVVSCLGDSCLPQVALGFDYLLSYPALFLSSVPLFRWCLTLHAIRAGKWVNLIYLSLLSIFVSGKHLWHFWEKSQSLFTDLLFLLWMESFFSNILCNLCFSLCLLSYHF